MNSDPFKTKGKIEDFGMYADCNQIIFNKDDAGTTSKSVEFSNLASETWYAGNTDYDPATGLVRSETASNQDKMLKFTQMVWRNTSKVAFGVQGDIVIGWYCDAKGNVGGAEDYKVNVGELCDKDTYNSCYAERALKAH